MALIVIPHAQTHVKVIYATYKVEHALIVNMECMADTATCLVPLTVKTTRVTCRMGHVWSVYLEYLEVTVNSRVQTTVKTEHATIKVVCV